LKYRRLGSTKLNVSVVGVGTWQFGGEWGVDYTQSEADAILKPAREFGINFIDTAECYGDHLSEHLISNTIKHNRDEWIVASKFGHHYNDRLNRDELWSAADVQMQAEVERIQREEVPRGREMAAWALAWCLQHPAVTCVIPGCKSPEQVRQNATASELEPTP
jgi:aryl-alcohol dehydrogenase-like predicted oxidoreductase